MTPIYLDNAASTPLRPEVWEAMRPWALKTGNPASSHAFGRSARQALDDARTRVAHCLDADPDEILFTSGATEANNLALFGLVGDAPGSLASAPVEHPCVTEPLQRLVARGFTSLNLPVQANGVVGPLPSTWPSDLRLATLMLANHETGSLQPVAPFRSHLPAKLPLHCDAAAAVGKIPVSFRSLGVSTLTLSGHKFHGPAGIGVLIVRRGVRLHPLFAGGHQQHGKRPGTEAVALAVGLAAALEWACQNLERHAAHVRQLRETFVQLLDQLAGPLVINGSGDGLPHVVNVSFPGLKADALLMALDLAGVACSTGSACSSGSLLPSPVLRAMGAPPEILHAAMRFSFSPLLEAAEVAEASRRIAKCVNRLRRLAGVADDGFA
ncbi:MAG: cysteine desulfurase family protein [Planctomycetota bacterium]